MYSHVHHTCWMYVCIHTHTNIYIYCSMIQTLWHANFYTRFVHHKLCVRSTLISHQKQPLSTALWGWSNARKCIRAYIIVCMYVPYWERGFQKESVPVHASSQVLDLAHLYKPVHASPEVLDFVHLYKKARCLSCPSSLHHFCLTRSRSR